MLSPNPGPRTLDPRMRYTTMDQYPHTHIHRISHMRDTASMRGSSTSLLVSMGHQDMVPRTILGPIPAVPMICPPQYIYQGCAHYLGIDVLKGYHHTHPEPTYTIWTIWRSYSSWSTWHPGWPGGVPCGQAVCLYCDVLRAHGVQGPTPCTTTQCTTTH